MSTLLETIIIVGGGATIFFYLLERLGRGKREGRVIEIEDRIKEKQKEVAEQEATAKISLEEYERLKKDYDNTRNNKPTDN